MVDAIEQCNPAVVHIAGHNQDGLRIVGFAQGEDGDYSLTEITAAELPEFVVGAAMASGGSCALECVVLNTCRSEAFAKPLIDLHQKLTDGAAEQHKRLRVICWPALTDDYVCQRYAKGFYGKFASNRAEQGVDWVNKCHTDGLRQMELMKKVKLTLALIRGDSP
jgi:hypothetical protein